VDAPRLGIVLGELELLLSNDLCVLVKYDETRRAAAEVLSVLSPASQSCASVRRPAIERAHELALLEFGHCAMILSG
jgi:hypothetical protein